MTRSRPSRALVTAAVWIASLSVAGEPEPYRSPYDLAYSPDGSTLAVSDRTAGKLVLVDVASRRVAREVDLRGEPTGLAWLDGSTVLVAEYGASEVAQVDASSGKVARRLAVGLRPMGLAVATKRRLLIAANTVTDDVSFVDLVSGEERARVRTPREPFFVAVTPDETVAVVGNLLPAGSAADPTLAAAVSLIDLETLTNVADIRLPPGSTAVRGVVVSPDGRWAYVTHTLGRFNVPATQLGRGWVNTNALSLIDLEGRKHHVSVLLDHPFEGSTDPWGLALSADGRSLWVTLSGTHELARVEVGALHELLAGRLPAALLADDVYGGGGSIWKQIRDDPSRRELLMNDLSALYVASLIGKRPLEGKGPRGLAASPDGKTLAVASYFSGAVELVGVDDSAPTARVPIGTPRVPDLVRRGEIVFHDATVSFQHWLSCATCHPEGARTDGLRWDLMNDGLGTPQRTRSLVMSHAMTPMTARGIRPDIAASVPKGLLFLMRTPEPELVDPLIAYLSSLRPLPSPYLVDGQLSERALRGKELFEGEAGCDRCHSGALGTDGKAHDVGTRGRFDRPDDEFYTPKLFELYRTAPFLHDARAATLEDVFTKHDAEGQHGRASKLRPEELQDLIAYLLSL